MDTAFQLSQNPCCVRSDLAFRACCALFDRFGKGLRSSARDALIADSTEGAYREKHSDFTAR